MARFDELRHTRWRDRLSVSRRQLLIGGGAAAGLFIAWSGWPRVAVPGINAGPDEAILSAYLKVGEDGHVTVLCPLTEMGQGAYTLIAQMAADELGADWRTVAVEPAPISDVYANRLLLEEDAAAYTPRLGIPDALAGHVGWRRFAVASPPPAMLTAGSATVRMYEEPVRAAAAIARALLCQAAAARWDVASEECATESGFVVHGTRRLRFGELAAQAAQQTPPAYPALRPREADSLAAQSLPRLDLPAKIDGSLNFAADVRLPDMVYAAVRQGPHGDSRLLRYNRRAAERVRGFVSVVRHDRWVAAVATDSWAAQRALDALAPTFRTTGLRPDSATIDRRLASAIRTHNGSRIASTGDIGDAFAGRPVISADYQAAPALHAPLEPPAATAQPDGGRMRVWVATQAPGFCRHAVAAALDLAVTDVALFAMPAGDASGSKLDHEAAIQAALIARAIDRPVQLCWSRAESLLRDLPRAPARARMQATLSSGATIDGWHASIAVPATRHELWARLNGAKGDAAVRATAGDSDAAALGGARPPYAIPHLALDHLPVTTDLPAGGWRGEADSYTSFFTEAFIDEMAQAAQVDPLSFRMGMLGHAPRLARCLQSATALGGWDGGVAGSGQGIACATLRGSHIALMATARPGERGLIVNRLIASVDCGRVVNPSITRQQIEGGLVFGLASAIGATTRYRRGLAQARRLGEVNLPILAQMPAITVELLISDAAPGGVEEIAAPLVAPALANALFTMTGRRIRRLPLSDKALAP